MASPLPPFNVGTLVPSTRDFVQAIKTRKKGLALVPLLAPEDAGREALRSAEEGVVSVAFAEPGAPMAEGAAAMRVPVLCLRPVTTKDDYLAARAYGADAVVLAAGLDEASREELAKGARSTRMFALSLVTSEAEAKRAADAGDKAVVVRATDASAVKALAAKLPASTAILAWPAKGAEDDVRALVGAVDAAIVGVEVYGVTGFERLVSELAG